MDLQFTDREKLTPPGQGGKVLLHSCCAPCSGEVMEAIAASGIEFAIYFYNPNIHPKKEYEIRKEENIRFAEKMGIPFVDADYDVQNWFTRAKGMEHERAWLGRCRESGDVAELDRPEIEDKIAATKAAIASGRRTIYQAALARVQSCTWASVREQWLRAYWEVCPSALTHLSTTEDTVDTEAMSQTERDFSSVSSVSPVVER